MKQTRIIVAGGRDFNDYALLKKSITNILDKLGAKGNSYNAIFVSGMADGADTLGEKYAEDFGYTVAKFPAHWDECGNVAGFMRNTEMAKYASEDNAEGILIAFWDGESLGTLHMIITAAKYGLTTFTIRY